ncbi:MAG: hypothetical protein FJ125_05125 [Deltaproteobacteria bacterium]|nr:hypothetical protein [Deltaproteobacteria bacterium]
MESKERKFKLLFWWNILLTSLLAFLAIPVAFADYGTFTDTAYALRLWLRGDGVGDNWLIKGEKAANVEAFYVTEVGDVRVGSSTSINGSVRVYGDRTDALRVATNSSFDVLRVDTQNKKATIKGQLIVDDDNLSPLVFSVDPTSEMVWVRGNFRVEEGMVASTIQPIAGQDLVFVIGAEPF